MYLGLWKMQELFKDISQFSNFYGLFKARENQGSKRAFPEKWCEGLEYLGGGGGGVLVTGHSL